MESKPLYITNRELRAEIHRSKNSFCAFISPDCARYDAIVDSLDSITPAVLDKARRKHAALLSTKGNKVDPEGVPETDLIIRVMTSEHIPVDPTRKGRGAKLGEEALSRVNFPPFKHYRLTDGVWTEIGRSHWKGGLANGEFCTTHGKMSRRLAEMFMLMVDRYSKKSNWRNYTYIDEMKGQALMHLSQIGLQFDESRSDNAFAYYTTVVNHCFTRILNVEKRNQKIRDDLLVSAGVRPSITRQIEHELEMQFGERRAEATPDSEADEGEARVQPAAPAKRKAKLA